MATIRFEREGGQAVDEIAWQAQDLSIVEKPNGPAAAALLSAGLGCLFLGIFTLLAEASPDIKADILNIKNRVGPLSGKTTFAVAVYLVSWAVLSAGLWKRSIPWGTVTLVTAILVALGFLFTFPEFFLLFEKK